GPDVEELLEGQLLALHLAMDAVHVLRPAMDLRLDAGGLKLRPQALAEFLDVALPVGTALVEGARDEPVILRLEVPERQVFELPFELPDAEAARERREDDPRLERPSLALGEARRILRKVAGMAQSHQLLGEPREDQPGIAHHREKHFAQRLALARIEPLGGRPVARQP